MKERGDDSLRLDVQVDDLDAVITIQQLLRGEWVTVGVGTLQVEGTMEPGASWAAHPAAAEALDAAIRALREHGIEAKDAATEVANAAWADAHWF